jgi:hypothetical protein
MKIPLTALTITTRDGTLAKDSKATNVLGGQKRPGLATVAQLPVGVGQGMFNFAPLGTLVVISNSIYSLTTGLLVAAIPSGVGPYDFTEVDTNGILAFKDAANIWTMQYSSVVVAAQPAVPATSTSAATLPIPGLSVGVNLVKVPRGVAGATVLQPGTGGTDGTYALTITAASGDTGSGAAGTYVISGGIVTAITITAVGDNYLVPPIATFPLGGITGATATVTVNNVPTAMLPGMVFLDSTYYVMTTDGKITGSNLSDPRNWDALNYLVLNADLGEPIAVAKQLNYVIGFADKFTSFYYDAGNPPPGSPLGPVQSAYMAVGCVNAGSICRIGGLLLFVGKTVTKGRGVYALKGAQYELLSDVYLDKVLMLSTLVGCSAMNMKVQGHELYLLTLPDLGITLAMDFNQKQWGVWTSSVSPAATQLIPGDYTQGVFAPVHYLDGDADIDLLQHPSNGKVYQPLWNVYTDDGLPIDVNLVTAQVEGENSDYVRIAAAEFIGDKVASTLYIRFSEDDYNTWGTYLPVDMSKVRSRAVRQGATRRRAYQLRHTDNAPLNARELHLEVSK